MTRRPPSSPLFPYTTLSRSQPPDRTPDRELRTAESLDEVTAPAEAERLERTQLRVHRAVAAGDSLGANTVAGDDSLPFEEELGKRPAIGRFAEQARGARPTSGGGGRPLS